MLQDLMHSVMMRTPHRYLAESLQLEDEEVLQQHRGLLVMKLIKVKLQEEGEGVEEGEQVT